MIEVGGLFGGHSGADVNLGRKGAVAVIAETSLRRSKGQ